MINVNKLKVIMKERNITHKMLSDKLGIDPLTLSKKLNDKSSSFTIGEADIIVKVLDLDVETATEIFFESCIINETK